MLTRDQALENIDRAVRGAAQLAHIAGQKFNAEEYRQNFYVGIDDRGHWRVCMRAKFIAENLQWPIDYAIAWKNEHGDPEEPPPDVRLSAW